MHFVVRMLMLSILLTACDRNTSQSQTERPATPQTGTTVTAEQKPEIEPVVKQPSPGQHAAEFLGAQACAGCHEAEYRSWKNSHHDLAMQDATERSVLGNFNNAEFDYFGTVSRFSQRDGQYFVRTDSATGKLQDFRIAYTFGVYPLQQYLVEFPNGRMQALSLAWDSRQKNEGGQRWFHLYPQEEIKPENPLHWTGINQNWNFMCADCHSTNLQKNYDSVSRTYSTEWSEINVGCEACHGPAAQHIAWAGLSAGEKAASTNKGFEISYAARRSASWEMDADTGIAKLRGSKPTQTEIPVCAQCHSRRSTSFPGARPQHEFLDHFNLSLLQEGLYHADGQIDGEVYVYGSFLQSKMHAQGVTCSNCHEPHSLKLRVAGNGLCAQCHLPAKFDTADHHLHSVKSSGSQCVNCHMPAKTYMQVDARRDHSFRVPRPDLSAKLGAPNACIGCHQNKSDAWAAEILQKKFGKPQTHYGEALYAGRQGLPGAEQALVKLIIDESQPKIARATAVSLLPPYLSNQSAQLLQMIAQGDDALLQLGMAQSMEQVPPQIRPALAIPLLYEEERVIAALAANALAGAPMDQYPAEVGKHFDKSLSEYLTSEMFNADRPESLVNLAGLYLQQGEVAKSENLFRDAIALEPGYGPAYINLADLYRTTGREQEVESVLRLGMETALDKAPIQHALGLSLVRQQKTADAMPLLRESAHSATASARYVYVYAIALNSTGKPQQAIQELLQGLQRFPQDSQILSALESIHREQGDAEAAQNYH